ncbi:MAG: flagellar motor protein MotB, partial [Desulfarculus sp.]|nr:flagellar motor protein MotB [Desulfarculus sp.]
RLEGPGFDPLGWMLTFSDLVTLLLTFFVMLLAMRSPEVQKLKAAFGIFERGGQGVLESTDRSRVPDILTKLDQVSQPRVDELKSSDQEAASQLELPGGEPQSLPSFLQPGINLRRDERGLVITLSNDVLFSPGKAVLSPEAVKRISQAAEILRYGTQPISVEGHTDNERLPGETPFKDNYDLSLARALAVAHQLIQGDGVDANRVRVAALGASRPLAPNDTPEHRAMNRRIEIVVLLNQS